MKSNSRIKTHIPGLDKMLKGGFLSGRNILLSGPCGSGKSTLAMQFVYSGAVKQKEPGLFITLEEPKEKIYENMDGFGWDIRGLEKTKKFFLVGSSIGEINNSMAKVDAKIIHLINEIKEVVEENKIKRVAIDSINLLTMLAEDESEKRNALASLCHTLSSLGCTSLLISETKEGSMDLSRYGIEEFIVDGVIVLYLIREGSKFIPGVSVRKMRGTNHDKEIRVYEIGKKGIVIYPQETMFARI